MNLNFYSSRSTVKNKNSFNISVADTVNDVAFCVHLSQTTSITAGSILIYDVIVTNVGNGYNVDLGSFVAPIHGLYYIELYLQTYQDVNSPLGIFLNRR